MVNDLRDHPRLTVAAGAVRAACSADEIAVTEEGYGLALSDELRAFYMDMNGAEIVWIERPELARDPGRFPEVSGRISIPTLPRLLGEWGDFLGLDAPCAEPDEASGPDSGGRCAHLRPFNFFEPDQANPQAVCLAREGGILHADRGLLHGGARWGDVPFMWAGRVVGLTDYLELLLATRGRRTWHDASPEVLASIVGLFPDAAAAGLERRTA